MTIQTTPVSLASLFTQLNAVIFSKGEVGRISHEEYERGKSGEMAAKIAAINTHDRHLKPHVLLVCLNLLMREDLITSVRHFHLKKKL